MANPLEQLAEGATNPILETLESAGAPLNLTGCTLTIEISDAKKRPLVIDQSKAVADADQAAHPGQVQFNRSADDLPASGSPYSVRWVVRDGAGIITKFPEEYPAQWVVRKP